MRPPALLLALAACLALPVQAESKQSDPDVREVRHTASISVADSVATIKVRRKFKRTSKHEMPFHLYVGLPGAGSFGNLRINTGNGWLAAEVMTSDDAYARWDAEVSEGQVPKRQPAGPAMAAHAGREAVTIDVPHFGRKPIEVTYEIVAPTCYADGRLHFAYPFGDLAPTLRGRGIKTSSIDSADWPDDVRPFRQQACHGSHTNAELQLAVSVPAPKRFSARWATMHIPGREIGRVEFEVPDSLLAVPKNARVVFLIDGSHSMLDPSRKGQLALSKAILEQLPAARAQVVVFRRKALAVLPGWTKAAQFDSAIAKLDQTALGGGNGSNLDRAFDEANRLLAPYRGPKRIIAFTDTRIPNTFDRAKVAAAVAKTAKNSVTHIIDFDPSSSQLDESTDFDHYFQPIARAQGGTVVSISGSTDDPDANLAQTKHLISPTRIDRFVLDTGGEEPVTVAELPAGLGHRAFVSRERLPHRIHLRGWLWGREFRHIATNSETFAAKLPRLAVGDPYAAELDEVELTALGLSTETVTEHTSLYASRGDKVVRPLWGIAGYGSGST